MRVRNLLLPALVLAVALPLAAQTAAAPRTLGDFSIESELPRRDVISQDMTGTCWSFATVSFLETEAQRLTGQEVDLSEMFPVWHAYMDKARRYVMLHGKTQLSEGGLSHDVIAMVKRHGIVPAGAYRGLKEGQNGHNHGAMFRKLEEALKPLAKGGAPLAADWEAQVAAILNEVMGPVPTEIEVDGKTMTPKEYAERTLSLPSDDYVEVMSYAYAPYWEKAELLVPDNWMHYGGYLNVPLDYFMAGIDHAIEKGYSVAIDMDVSERTVDWKKGIALLSPEEEAAPVTAELREAMFRDRRTTDDHLMHIVGFARDAAGKRFYVTKNSHGRRSGADGYLMMSPSFVRAKALAYMVHKDALPALER